MLVLQDYLGTASLLLLINLVLCLSVSFPECRGLS